MSEIRRRLQLPGVLLGLAIGAAVYAVDILIVDDGTTVRLALSDTGNLAVTSNDATGPGLKVTQQGTGMIMSLFDDTSEVMTVLDGGNVGIGTTTPEDHLDIWQSSQHGGIGVKSFSAASDSHYAELGFFRSHSSTLGTKTTTIPGDWLLRILGYGVETGGNWRDGFNMYAIQDGPARSSAVPTRFAIALDTNSARDYVAFAISGANGGNVGIGTTTPTKRLYVNGSAGGTQAWNASDARWKTDIKPIEGALEAVLKLRGVTYRWRDGDESESRGFDDRTHFGVVAQELEEVLPDLVDHPGETDEYKHVEYNGLSAVLIEAVKQQQLRIEAQQEELTQLRAANESFKIRQVAQQRELSRLKVVEAKQTRLEALVLALIRDSRKPTQIR